MGLQTKMHDHHVIIQMHQPSTYFSFTCAPIPIPHDTLDSILHIHKIVLTKRMIEMSDSCPVIGQLSTNLCFSLVKSVFLLIEKKFSWHFKAGIRLDQAQIFPFNFSFIVGRHFIFWIVKNAKNYYLILNSHNM